MTGVEDSFCTNHKFLLDEQKLSLPSVWLWLYWMHVIQDLNLGSREIYLFRFVEVRKPTIWTGIASFYIKLTSQSVFQLLLPICQAFVPPTHNHHYLTLHYYSLEWWSGDQQRTKIVSSVFITGGKCKNNCASIIHKQKQIWQFLCL